MQEYTLKNGIKIKVFERQNQWSWILTVQPTAQHKLKYWTPEEGKMFATEREALEDLNNFINIVLVKQEKMKSDAVFLEKCRELE